jgi:hypothetical protein
MAEHLHELLARRVAIFGDVIFGDIVLLGTSSVFASLVVIVLVATAKGFKQLSEVFDISVLGKTIFEQRLDGIGDGLDLLLEGRRLHVLEELVKLTDFERGIGRETRSDERSESTLDGVPQLGDLSGHDGPPLKRVYLLSVSPPILNFLVVMVVVVV